MAGRAGCHCQPRGPPGGPWPSSAFSISIISRAASSPILGFSGLKGTGEEPECKENKSSALNPSLDPAKTPLVCRMARARDCPSGGFLLPQESLSGVNGMETQRR